MFSNNRTLSTLLKEISHLYELKGSVNKFRAIAYKNASGTIARLQKDIADYTTQERLNDIEGIGKRISSEIDEFLRTGKIKKHQTLKKKFPAALLELMEIRSLGPQTVKKIYRRFKISSVKELENILKSKKIKALKGFGDKKISSILKGLNAYKKGTERMTLWEALSLGNDWIRLTQAADGVQKAELAGSLRRRKSTIGDIDILICAGKKFHTEIIGNLATNERVKEILVQGSTKLSIIDAISEKQIDFRVVEPKSWGSALLYFTGSKEHTIHLREIAKKRNFKISEYGLFDENENYIAGETEEEIYEKLGFDPIAPEMRENNGEFELSAKHCLPDLINYDDIKGDFEMHSAWSDGKNTIAEITDYIRNRFNYKFIVVTDHSKSVRIAGGLNSSDFRKQLKEIDLINKKLGIPFIKKGIEVDILKDGSLDMDDETLLLFDWVTAAIHSHFSIDNTERIVKACHHPLVNAIGHPTGRILGVREPYLLDMSKIIEAARETGTALEINAQPNRMDMDDLWAKCARENGVKIILGTDSHNLEEFDFMNLGVSIARRAWCEKKDVLNTMDWSRIRKIAAKKHTLVETR